MNSDRQTLEWQSSRVNVSDWVLSAGWVCVWMFRRTEEEQQQQQQQHPSAIYLIRGVKEDLGRRF